jgi:hypothetical protein
MDKQTKQLVITAGLVVVLILAMLGNLKKKPQKKAIPEPSPAQPVAPSVSPVGTAAGLKPNDELSLQLERLKLSWGRDPFAFTMDKGFQRNELKLKGISFGKEKGGFAFINNEIVKKGDTIGDYEVADVQKDRVFLRRGNQDFYLMFPEEQ